MMECKIDGCGKRALYKSQRVCQKHYFRYMRYGTYELTMKPRKYRYTHSSGYQLIYEPEHPLANSTGYVYEHRKIMHAKHGDSTPDCAICGKKTDWNWLYSHVDHINSDTSDNRECNLRMLCSACNTWRSRNPASEHGVFTLTIDGVTKTAYGWASTEGATHTGNSIKQRYRAGISAYECVFGENKTHKNKSQKLKSSVKQYKRLFRE